jgi:hypothetical protein
MVMMFPGSRKADWTAYIAGAISALDTATGRDGYYHTRTGSLKAVEAIKVLLPYCLHPMIDMPDHWIWLNRHYKPLGTYDHIDSYHFQYESFVQHHVRKDDPRIAEFLERCEPIDRDAVWVFLDHTSPFESLCCARDFADLLRTIDISSSAKAREAQEP